MELNRGTFILLIFIIIFLLPSPYSRTALTSDDKKLIQKFYETNLYERDVLQNSTFESGYGNITGFRLSYKDVLLGKNDSSDSSHLEGIGDTILPPEIEKEAIHIWNKETEDEDDDDTKQIQNEEHYKVEREHEHDDDDDDDNKEDESHKHDKRSKLYKLKDEEDHYKASKKRSPFLNVTGTVKGEWKSFDNKGKKFVNIPMYVPKPFSRARSSKFADGFTILPDDNQSEKDTDKGFEDYDHGFKDDNFYIPLDDNNIDDEVSRNNGNITVNKGKIRVEVYDSKRPIEATKATDTSFVGISITLKDTKDLETHTLEMKGVHFHDSGNVISTTNSLKFGGIYGLPHLMFDSNHFELSKDLLLAELNKTLEKEKEKLNDKESLSTALEASDKCEYIAYLHYYKTHLSKDELKTIDKELMNPIGRPHKPIPKLEVTGLLYSPDCGIAISVNKAEGVREQVYWAKAKAVVFGIIFLFLAQIIFFIRQMNDSNTPSSMSMISFWSLALINLVDGSFCMAFLLSSIIFEYIFLPLIAAAFLAFTLATVFEMRYMLLVYNSQINEVPMSLATAINRNRDESVNNNNVGTAAVPGEPTLPTTNPPQPITPAPNPVTLVPGEQSTASTLYIRFYFALLCFTFIVINSLNWSTYARYPFEYVILLLINSFWAPQIYRNIKRGCRRSFKWEFILATSFIRTTPVIYICFIDFVFGHRYEPILCYSIIGWIWFQILILACQEIFGPRFLLPKSLLPKSYDYHPILTRSDLENGFGIEFIDDNGDINTVETGSPQESNKETNETTSLINGGASLHQIRHDEHSGHSVVDCAICMSAVELVVLSSKDSLHTNSPQNVLARRRYMVAPCGHIFHTDCLESWMKYKLQCPVCRSSLPPL